MDRSADDAGLVGWLAGHDEPCPVCGHNLRGCPAARCPECGAPLRLAVASENARLGPWLLALGSFVLALGFDAVVTLILTVPAIVSGFVQGGPPAQFFMVLGLMATLSVSMAIAAWLLLRRQRGWRRLGRKTQWRAVWGIFVGVGLLHLCAGGLVVLWMS